MAAQHLQRLLLLLLLLLLHCACIYDGQLQQAAVDAAALDDPNSYILKNCSDDTFPASSTYNNHLISLQQNLTVMSSSHRFSPYASKATDSAIAAIYGMYQCLGYLNLTQCASCVETAIRTASDQCPQSISARVELSACSFLYQNTTIRANYSFLTDVKSGADNNDSIFLVSRRAELQNVSSAAFATSTLYSSVVRVVGTNFDLSAVAQCHGYLNSTECHQCLADAPDTVSVILGNQTGGRSIYGSCMYRYESDIFFTEENLTTAPAAPTTDNSNRANKKPLVIGVVVACCLLLVVSFCIFVIRAKRNSPKIAYHRNKGATDFLELQESLQQHQIRMFTSQQMKTATKNFHEDTKLGQGGFGVVYKGTLQDGQIVAIKRLTHPSSQGKRQFLSEVKTITSVRHRNLIRLLGCCVDGSDRLLVYEYLEKQSLDKHIFDITNVETALSWNARRKIIMGIAKGLAYLHHESHLCIVHRDIKAANILLDDNLDPKIADFGLARLFTIDQTHVSTQIAGTIGYLAPECATNGQISQKSDTFSFGLVILEVLSGRRVINSQLCLEQQGLLSWTWKLYKGGQQLELVDPFLVEKSDYVAEEANRMVHVALLCTQSIPEVRPAMSKVVMLLEDTDHDCQPLDVSTSSSSDLISNGSTTRSF